MDGEKKSGLLDFFRSRAGLAWLGLGAIAAFYLWTEHRAHLLGALPYLIFLACPLMHLFMHHGHGHGSHEHEPRPADGTATSQSREKQP